MVVAAKSISNAYATKPFPPDPNSQQSTINTVEREIREAGGKATAISVDTRDFESVQRLVEETVNVCKTGRKFKAIVNGLADLRSY